MLHCKNACRRETWRKQLCREDVPALCSCQRTVYFQLCPTDEMARCSCIWSQGATCCAEMHLKCPRRSCSRLCGSLSQRRMLQAAWSAWSYSPRELPPHLGFRLTGKGSQVLGSQTQITSHCFARCRVRCSAQMAVARSFWRKCSGNPSV